MEEKLLEQAVLAGDCFWCVEAALGALRGVVKVEPGYAGGAAPNPSYEQVCTGETGHAEAVRIGFDPEIISFRELLEAFFAVHDPTTLNRQGADVGTQYRSAVFYLSDEQRRTAEEMIEELGSELPAPIVTEVAPLKQFCPAEDYHRDYYRRNPDQGYCRAVIAPKLAKFRRAFQDKIRG